MLIQLRIDGWLSWFDALHLFCNYLLFSCFVKVVTLLPPDLSISEIISTWLGNPGLTYRVDNGSSHLTSSPDCWCERELTQEKKQKKNLWNDKYDKVGPQLWSTRSTCWNTKLHETHTVSSLFELRHESKIENSATETTDKCLCYKPDCSFVPLPNWWKSGSGC